MTYDATNGPDHPWHGCAPNRRRRSDVRESLKEHLPRPGGPDPSAGDGRRTSAWAVLRPGLVCGSPMRPTVAIAMAVSTAPSIADVLAGRWHLAPDGRSERPLQDLCFEVPTGRPRLPVVDAAPARAMVGAPTVEPVPPCRPNAKGTLQRLGPATGLMGTIAADVAEALVACPLRTPGGRLDVRQGVVPSDRGSGMCAGAYVARGKRREGFAGGIGPITALEMPHHHDAGRRDAGVIHGAVIDVRPARMWAADRRTVTRPPVSLPVPVVTGLPMAAA